MRKKLTALTFMLLVSLAFGIGLNAQTVTGNYRQQSLKTVLKDIERQTELSVIYKPDEVNDSKIITTTFDKTPVKDAVVTLVGKEMEVTIQGRMIVIAKRQGEVSKRLHGDVLTRF